MAEKKFKKIIDRQVRMNSEKKIHKFLQNLNLSEEKIIRGMKQLMWLEPKVPVERLKKCMIPRRKLSSNTSIKVQEKNSSALSQKANLKTDRNACQTEKTCKNEKKQKTAHNCDSEPVIKIKNKYKPLFESLPVQNNSFSSSENGTKNKLEKVRKMSTSSHSSFSDEDDVNRNPFVRKKKAKKLFTSSSETDIETIRTVKNQKRRRKLTSSSSSRSSSSQLSSSKSTTSSSEDEEEQVEEKRDEDEEDYVINTSFKKPKKVNRLSSSSEDEDNMHINMSPKKRKCLNKLSSTSCEEDNDNLHDKNSQPLKRQLSSSNEVQQSEEIPAKRSRSVSADKKCTEKFPLKLIIRKDVATGASELWKSLQVDKEVIEDNPVTPIVSEQNNKNSSGRSTGTDNLIKKNDLTNENDVNNVFDSLNKSFREKENLQRYDVVNENKSDSGISVNECEIDNNINNENNQYSKNENTPKSHKLNIAIFKNNQTNKCILKKSIEIKKTVEEKNSSESKVTPQKNETTSVNLVNKQNIIEKSIPNNVNSNFKENIHKLRPKEDTLLLTPSTDPQNKFSKNKENLFINKTNKDFPNNKRIANTSASPKYKSKTPYKSSETKSVQFFDFLSSNCTTFKDNTKCENVEKNKTQEKNCKSNPFIKSGPIKSNKIISPKSSLTDVKISEGNKNPKDSVKLTQKPKDIDKISKLGSVSTPELEDNSQFQNCPIAIKKLNSIKLNLKKNLPAENNPVISKLPQTTEPRKIPENIEKNNLIKEPEVTKLKSSLIIQTQLPEPEVNLENASENFNFDDSDINDDEDDEQNLVIDEGDNKNDVKTQILEFNLSGKVMTNTGDNENTVVIDLVDEEIIDLCKENEDSQNCIDENNSLSPLKKSEEAKIDGDVSMKNKNEESVIEKDEMQILPLTPHKIVTELNNKKLPCENDSFEIVKVIDLNDSLEIKETDLNNSKLPHINDSLEIINLDDDEIFENKSEDTHLESVDLTVESFTPTKIDTTIEPTSATKDKDIHHESIDLTDEPFPSTKIVFPNYEDGHFKLPHSNKDTKCRDQSVLEIVHSTEINSINNLDSINEKESKCQVNKNSNDANLDTLSTSSFLKIIDLDKEVEEIQDENIVQQLTESKINDTHSDKNDEKIQHNSDSEQLTELDIDDVPLNKNDEGIKDKSNYENIEEQLAELEVNDTHAHKNDNKIQHNSDFEKLTELDIKDISLDKDDEKIQNKFDSESIDDTDDTHLSTENEKIQSKFNSEQLIELEIDEISLDKDDGKIHEKSDCEEINLQLTDSEIDDNNVEENTVHKNQSDPGNDTKMFNLNEENSDVKKPQKLLVTIDLEQIKDILTVDRKNLSPKTIDCMNVNCTKNSPTESVKACNKDAIKLIPEKSSATEETSLSISKENLNLTEKQNVLHKEFDNDEQLSIDKDNNDDLAVPKIHTKQLIASFETVLKDLEKSINDTTQIETDSNNLLTKESILNENNQEIININISKKVNDVKITSDSCEETEKINFSETKLINEGLGFENKNSMLIQDDKLLSINLINQESNFEENHIDSTMAENNSINLIDEENNYEENLINVTVKENNSANLIDKENLCKENDANNIIIGNESEIVNIELPVNNDVTNKTDSENEVQITSSPKSKECIEKESNFSKKPNPDQEVSSSKVINRDKFLSVPLRNYSPADNQYQTPDLDFSSLELNFPTLPEFSQKLQAQTSIFQEPVGLNQNPMTYLNQINNPTFYNEQKTKETVQSNLVTNKTYVTYEYDDNYDDYDDDESQLVIDEGEEMMIIKNDNKKNKNLSLSNNFASASKTNNLCKEAGINFYDKQSIKTSKSNLKITEDKILHTPLINFNNQFLPNQISAPSMPLINEDVETGFNNKNKFNYSVVKTNKKSKTEKIKKSSFKDRLQKDMSKLSIGINSAIDSMKFTEKNKKKTKKLKNDEVSKKNKREKKSSKNKKVPLSEINKQEVDVPVLDENINNEILDDSREGGDLEMMELLRSCNIVVENHSTQNDAVPMINENTKNNSTNFKALESESLGKPINSCQSLNVNKNVIEKNFDHKNDITTKCLKTVNRTPITEPSISNETENQKIYGILKQFHIDSSIEISVNENSAPEKEKQEQIHYKQTKPVQNLSESLDETENTLANKSVSNNKQVEKENILHPTPNEEAPTSNPTILAYSCNEKVPNYLESNITNKNNDTCKSNNYKECPVLLKKLLQYDTNPGITNNEDTMTKTSDLQTEKPGTSKQNDSNLELQTGNIEIKQELDAAEEETQLSTNNEKETTNVDKKIAENNSTSESLTQTQKEKPKIGSLKIINIDKLRDKSLITNTITNEQQNNFVLNSSIPLEVSIPGDFRNEMLPSMHTIQIQAPNNINQFSVTSNTVNSLHQSAMGNITNNHANIQYIINPGSHMYNTNVANLCIPPNSMLNNELPSTSNYVPPETTSDRIFPQVFIQQTSNSQVLRPRISSTQQLTSNIVRNINPPPALVQPNLLNNSLHQRILYNRRLLPMPSQQSSSNNLNPKNIRSQNIPSTSATKSQKASTRPQNIPSTSAATNQRASRESQNVHLNNHVYMSSSIPIQASVSQNSQIQINVNNLRPQHSINLHSNNLHPNNLISSQGSPIIPNPHSSNELNLEKIKSRASIFNNPSKFWHLQTDTQEKKLYKNKKFVEYLLQNILSVLNIMKAENYNGEDISTNTELTYSSAKVKYSILSLGINIDKFILFQEFQNLTDKHFSLILNEIVYQINKKDIQIELNLNELKNMYSIYENITKLWEKNEIFSLKHYVILLGQAINYYICHRIHCKLSIRQLQFITN